MFVLYQSFNFREWIWEYDNTHEILGWIQQIIWNVLLCIALYYFIIRYTCYINVNTDFVTRIHCKWHLRYPQEGDRGQYTPLFAKHFLSEGITHGHTIVCVGERVAKWLTTLPKPVEQDPSGILIQFKYVVLWLYMVHRLTV